MWGKSLVLVCAIVVLGIASRRLDAQGQAQTAIATLPGGETVEILTDSIQFPDPQAVATVDLPRGTTAVRAEGGDVTFPAGATLALPSAALRAWVQPSSPPPSTGPTPQPNFHWMVITLRISVADGRPLMQIMGPFTNAAMCDATLKGVVESLTKEGLEPASSACRTDMKMLVP